MFKITTVKQRYRKHKHFNMEKCDSSYQWCDVIVTTLYILWIPVFKTVKEIV